MTQPQLVVVSTSHRNAAVELRDRCTLSPEQIERAEARLAATAPVEEAAILSTCNRTEVYTVSSRVEPMTARVRALYREIKGIDLGEAWNPLERHNERAAEHLLRVAAGLESLVLGENQILSQVRRVHERILATDVARPVLSRLWREAVHAGKRVRTRTALCEGAVSISQAAVELARKVFSRLDRTRVLILGAGETATLVLKHLRSHGVRRVTIANRTLARAEALTAAHAGRALPLDRIPEALAEADIVVSATACPGTLVTRAQVEPALRKRQGDPVVMVDISTPRDLDPEIAELYGVFLYNIDHLRGIVDENLARRSAEIPAAETILHELTAGYWGWVKGLSVTPTISRLTEYFHEVCRQELERQRPKMREAEFERFERATRSLVQKLLHFPVTSLREMANGERLDRNLIRAVREIYRLSAGEEPGRERPGDPERRDP